MTAPRPHNQLPPLCEMARLWISMAADGECGEVERAAGVVAAAAAAAVLGVAVAGWNSSSPHVTTPSGVVRPSEIVVGWNTSDTLDGRPLSAVRLLPNRPTPRL